MLRPAPCTADVGLTRHCQGIGAPCIARAATVKLRDPAVFPSNTKLQPQGGFVTCHHVFSAPLERMCNDICLHCLEGTDNHTPYKGKPSVSTSARPRAGLRYHVVSATVHLIIFEQISHKIHPAKTRRRKHVPQTEGSWNEKPCCTH